MQQQKISSQISADNHHHHNQQQHWSSLDSCQQQQLQRLATKQQQLFEEQQQLLMSCAAGSGSTHSPIITTTTVTSSASLSSSVCTVPVRDAASLKSIRYGPGHEKFPSWPGVGDGEGHAPHPARSKSWTDHTNYPKERQQPLARPKPQPFTQQLKTVMERCEKLPADMFDSSNRAPAPLPTPDPPSTAFPLPRLDRDGKVLGEDCDYSVPSPPERDLHAKLLTQADLEEYARTYDEPHQYAQIPTESHLTRAELEQYTRAYEDSNALRPSHQTQASYAQSEGYHSYVSSTDSTTTTPFLDRLRRDSEAVGISRCPVGSEGGSQGHEGRGGGSAGSASSGSSSETLKWHGSLSDVSSVVSGSSSSAAGPSAAHAAGSAAPAIAHSARVAQPQRHYSESLGAAAGGGGVAAPSWVQRNNQINNQMRRLFPVSTYTVQPNEEPINRSPPSTLSVAERINELERQQLRLHSLKEQQQDKRCAATAADHKQLKAIQKRALLSFYERHHSAWKSEPQLQATTAAGGGPPLRPKGAPPPMGTAVAAQQPQQQLQQPSRRSSCASDYAGAAWREMVGSSKETRLDSNGHREIRHQHSSSCGSLSTAVLGPIIVGPSISVDDWVPARPPKKPHLRAAYGGAGAPHNPPSPDLPPPSPPPVDAEAEVFISDEPLPPPPSEDQFEWISKPQALTKQHHNMVPPQPTRSQLSSSTSPQQNHKNRPFFDNKISPSQEISANGTTKYGGDSQMINSERSSLNSSYVDNSRGNLSSEGLRNNEFTKHISSSPMMKSERLSLNSSYVDSSKGNLSTESFRNEFTKHNSNSQVIKSERSYVESSESCMNPEGLRNEYSKHGSQLVNVDRVATTNSSSNSKRSPNTYYENQIDMLRQSLQQSLPVVAEPQTRGVEGHHSDNHNHRLESHQNVVLESQNHRLDNLKARLDNQNLRQNVSLENHNCVKETHRKISQHDLHHAQSYNQNSYGSSGGVVSTASGSRSKADVINGVESRVKDCNKVGEGVSDNKLTEGVVPVVQKTTWKAYSDQFQPRSLDSNLSVDSRYETHNSKPGPQTPADKSVVKSPQKIGSDFNALKTRIQNVVTTKSNIFRKNSFSGRNGGTTDEQHQSSGFESIKNVFQQCSERNSFRFSTAAQKLLVDGKIANAVQKGTISPTHRYAPGSGQLAPGSRQLVTGSGQFATDNGQSAPGSRQLVTGSGQFVPDNGQSAPGNGQLVPGSGHFAPVSGQFQRASIRKSKVDLVPAATVHSSQLQYARNHVEPVKGGEERRLPPTLPPQCPPTSHQRSQSKASAYLAYRREPREREKGLPNFTGSYKRTMSPSGGQIKSINSIDNQDTIMDKPPVPHTPTLLDNQPLDNNHLNNNNNVNNNNHHLQSTNNITDKKQQPLLPTVETKMSPSQEQHQQQQHRIANCQTSIVNIVNSSNEVICDNSSSVRVDTSSTSSLSSLSSSSSSTTQQQQQQRTTLPRNYSMPEQQQKRPILRTARTQSDPVNAVAVLPQDSNVKVIKSSSSSASVNSDNSISIAINQSSNGEDSGLKREESFQKVITVSRLSGPEDHSQDGVRLHREESFQKGVTVSRLSGPENHFQDGGRLQREESFQKMVTVSSRLPSPTVSVATSTSPDPENSSSEVTVSSSEVSITISDATAEKTSEPLRLVQRTEVTLRVNAATTDAASQTEQTPRTPSPSSSTTSSTQQQASSLLRLPLREEIECDQLSRDLATRLPPKHRLQGILAPGPEVKKCTDYVSGLFRLDLLPRSRTSLASSTTTTASNCENVSDTANGKVKEGEEEEAAESTKNLSANSAYFTTSECKARLLALCSHEAASNCIGPNDNLHQKKEELMSRLSRKLRVLRDEAVAVAEESRLNDTLGETVSARASAQGARPHEMAKLRLHAKEVGHITQLLLGLSGRLARAENALLALDTDSDPERKILEEKRDKLRAQLEEAKQLKVSIDRRSGSVQTMLYKYLSADEFADYDHFIGMKAKLLIDSREIDDKIKLGEEQLSALQEMLDDS